ncbi:hypothetical protein LPJ68_002909 [Coemansia sp. RSA 1086]|nr:hypothetical protein LPJ68_002909 [Coemansia sp. RSA 1086]
MDVDIDWNILDAWLKELFAPELPPLISKTPAMLKQLKTLYQLHKPILTAQQTVENVQSEAAREYTALAANIADILKTANITLSGLSHPTSKALLELSATASDLGLSDMRIESFECAIASQTIQRFKQQTEAALLAEKTQKLQEKIRNSQSRQAKLRALLEERQSTVGSEEQKSREWVRNAQVVQQKSSEYRERLEELQRIQSERQAEARGLEYEQLKQLNDRVEQMRASVDEKQNMYDGYKALPPDIQLAYLKLEEAKVKLDQLRADCEVAADACF